MNVITMRVKILCVTNAMIRKSSLPNFRFTPNCVRIAALN